MSISTPLKLISLLGSKILTHEHRVCRGISWFVVFPDVSNQCHDHHGVDSKDVSNPTIQNPVLQDKPTGTCKNIYSAEQIYESICQNRITNIFEILPYSHLSKEDT